MPDKHRAVTIKEVAEKAGVSVATISRVLSGKGPVRETTSRRVMETCQAMRFTPHGIAQSLSLRRTHTVGLLLPDLHGEFFSEVIRGIDGEARRSGYHLLVSGFHSDRQEIQDDAKSAGMMNDEKIRAAIMAKARENNLPLSDDGLKISRGGNQITITADFVVPIDFPGYTYNMSFHEEKSNPIF